MADILPYLGVTRTFSEDELAGKSVIVPDLTGLTAEEVKKQLKSIGLTAKAIGTEATVTQQIPQAGQTVPGGSEILVYYGETAQVQNVEVPDFTGMNRQQATDAAGALGLYILVSGNQEVSAQVVATKQDIPPKTQVQVGTTVRLEFTNTKAPD